jgi:hypothetical protein
LSIRINKNSYPRIKIKVDMHDAMVYQVGALSATGKCSKVQYTKTIMKTSSKRRSFLKSSLTSSILAGNAGIISGLINTPGVAGASTTIPDTTASANHYKWTCSRTKRGSGEHPSYAAIASAAALTNFSQEDWDAFGAVGGGPPAVYDSLKAWASSSYSPASPMVHDPANPVATFSQERQQWEAHTQTQTNVWECVTASTTPPAAPST